MTDHEKSHLIQFLRGLADQLESNATITGEYSASHDHGQVTGLLLSANLRLQAAFPEAAQQESEAAKLPIFAAAVNWTPPNATENLKRLLEPGD